MPKFRLPTTATTNDMLGMVFGEDTESFEGSPVDPSQGYVATFVDDENTLVAIGACDASFGAYAGSALSLIPKPGAQDAIKEGSLPKPMLDNLYEVMNICSRLLMDERTPHLRLAQLLPPGESPDEAIQLVESGTAAHLKVDVPRYGMGNLSFYVA
jgi:hypothetical protein